MNTAKHGYRKLAIAVTAALLLGACATQVSTPEGAVTARSKLMQLQGNAQLASLAPIEIQEAELAVAAAEQPERDQELSAHLVLLANRKVDIAQNWAQSRLYEDQREALSRASDQARLDARTREVNTARRETRVAQDSTRVAQNQTERARSETDRARTDTAIALNEAGAARDAAEVARNQTVTARRDTAAAQRETAELEREIAELNARNTDRGLVVTLGDVLFATGKSTIIGSNDSNLAKLAVFLKRYDDRMVTIEGHTDDVGTESSNMNLSQSRADAVKSYLVAEGIAASRLDARGKGEGSPVSSNATDTGRQQNRRVEVIIANGPAD